MNQFKRTCEQEPSPTREKEIEPIQEKLNLLVGFMEKGCKQAVTIIETLKSFSRLDEAALQECIIEDGIESSLALCASELSKAKIQVHRDFSLKQMVVCYPGLLNQVFMHLLSNAMFAIAEAKTPGNIWISTAKTEGSAVVKFMNDGSPINARIQNRIFDPFFTTRDVGQGRGMGLSICYGIMKKHSGAIAVKNTDNGVAFTLQFPLAPGGLTP
jgi:signal transduction histidine kinase